MKELNQKQWILQGLVKFRLKHDIFRKGKYDPQYEFNGRREMPISMLGYTVGKLMDGTECQILLDTGASKSFMSKSYYLCCKALHLLPKFASKMQRIQVGNRQHVSVLL